MISVKTNVKQVMKKLEKIEQVKRKAVNESLKNTAVYAKRESAKEIRDTQYSTAPLGLIRSKIYTKRKGTRSQPVSEQSASVKVRGGDIPVMYMRPRNKIVRSRLGKRWGVTVSTSRLREDRELTGAFHLKSEGRRTLRGGAGKQFDRRSKLFTRGPTGDLKQYHFRTFSQVLEDSGRDDAVITHSEDYLDKQLSRNVDRYMRQAGL